MAMGISKILPPFFCFFFLSFLTLCSSGSQVNLSERNEGISSPIKTIWKHSVFPNQIKVLVTDYRDLRAFCDSGVYVDIIVDEIELKNHRKSTASVVSWLNTHLPCINITSIIVSSSSPDSGCGEQLASILDSLKSVHSALESLDLNREVKVSIAFSQPMLENSQRWHAKDLNQIMEFIRNSGSFVVLETEINDTLGVEDHFVGLMIKAGTLLRHKDVPIVLSVKSSAIPTSIEFSERVLTYIKSHGHFAERISGVFAPISSMQEQEFHGSNRQLLSHNSPMEVTLHDVIRQSSLVPTIVTVPATNPVITSPVNSATNPAATPITAPPTDPVATPLMVPPTNNLAPPFVTVPVTPPTTINPTPPTVPITPPTPVVNPVTPPGTTNPPTTSGQAWCVAKTGASQSALQAGIDYACGMGGADCSAIQPSGSCYNPNNPQNHASYAFNSYYQKNPAPTSCDFKGAATLVNSNPSTGSCIYPSSSSSSSSSSISPPATPLPSSPPATPLLSSPPPVTTLPSPPTLSSPPPATTSTPTTPPATTSSGLPPFMLNSSNPDSAAPTIYGTSPPPGSSVSMAASLRPLYISIILVQFVFGNLCWP